MTNQNPLHAQLLDGKGSAVFGGGASSGDFSVEEMDVNLIIAHKSVPQAIFSDVTKL